MYNSYLPTLLLYSKVTEFERKLTGLYVLGFL